MFLKAYRGASCLNSSEKPKVLTWPQPRTITRNPSSTSSSHHYHARQTFADLAKAGGFGLVKELDIPINMFKDVFILSSQF
jgi:hypothetical protein